MRARVLWVLAVAAVGCGTEPGEDAWEADGAEEYAASETALTRPKMVGAIRAGEVKQGKLGGTTPDGWTFDLAHLRRVTFEVQTISAFSARVRVYGPVRGTTVPSVPLWESPLGGRPAFEGRALPAAGRYVVGVVCVGTSAKCRGKKYALLASWGAEPDATATVRFLRGGSPRETIEGALVRGRLAVVRYDAARYDLNAMNYDVADPGCRMSPTMHYRQKAGEAFAAYVPEAEAPELYRRDELSAVIPVRADAQFLEIYWRADQVGRSCANPNPQIWDSNRGANFFFAVPDAVASFPESGAPQVLGALRRGGTVAVSYPLARMYRLLTCRPAYMGFNMTEVKLYWRFDGGAFREETIARPYNVNDGQHPGPFAPVLAVPAGARELELYFHGVSQGGCDAWDSDYGRNFRFRIP